MKTFKFILLYIFIFLFLTQIYDEQTMQLMYFHYSLIDFRYLIFIALHFIWGTLLFEIIYQYICLYTFMHIRLSYKCLKILIYRLLIYCLLYIGIHVFLFTIYSYQIPWQLVFLNLFIQIFGFTLTILFHKDWNYSYFSMISFILLSHFVI